MAINFSNLGGVPKGGTDNRPSDPSIGDVYYNGDLVQQEIYTNGGWVALNATPGTPTSVSAVDVGTSRAFNNGAATITFTEPTGAVGGAATFTAVSSPGSYTTTSATSPITVTGLASNTAYTFNLTGNNANGAGPTVTSGSITATTVPATPSAPTATNVINTAFGSAPSSSIAFTAPATGGKSITGYTVTSTPGSLTATGSSSPLVITGLTAGTDYTYTVKATNSNGDSLTSSNSSSLTASTKPGTTGTPTATVVGPTSVTLSFTDANNGGSAITGYTVTSTPSVSLSASGTASSLTATGAFAANTAYTFVVAATNANGTGSNSTSSNSITPSPSAPFSMLMPTSNALYVSNGSLGA